MRRQLVLGIVVSMCMAAPAAWADVDTTAEKASDAATERARKLHREGDALYDAGDFAGAYAAYIAAWSLKKHYQIAGNLGDCELQLGKYRDAAEHLAIFARDYPKDKPRERLERATALLAQARSHVGTVQVTVASAGAEVFVDGTSAGVAPIREAIFLEPGLHLVEARLGQEVGWETVEAREGEKRSVTVKLSSRGVSSMVAAPQPKWPVIASGIALTVAGAGAGVGFIVAAREKADAAEAFRSKYGSDHCNSNPGSQECQSVTKLGRQEQQLQGIAFGAFALGGAAAIMTLTYAAWPREAAAKPPKVGASFHVLPGSAGVSVQGQF
jgi:tetratricopeptide (TPR) repeat protein